MIEGKQIKLEWQSKLEEMVNQIISTYLEENIRQQSHPSKNHLGAGDDEDEEDEDENFQKREKT